MAEITDDELINRILQGEKECGDILYKRYYKKVYAKCLGMTHNVEIAEDQCHDILLKTINAIDTFKGDAKFSTWIYSITYNHCLDYLRKNKRIKFDDWSDLLSIPDDQNEEEVIRIMELKKERLILLLEMLKPLDKAIIILKYWEGMSLERIQYILSIETEGALKMKLMRARKRMRAIYDKFYPVSEH